jgi:hypothetical protein
MPNFDSNGTPACATRLKVTARASKRSQRTHARITCRCRLRHRLCQLLSHGEHPAHHLHAPNSSKHAKISVRTPACASRVRTTKNGQRSRADAGSIGPSDLPASAAMMVSTSVQQAMASCHSQRARAVPATTERRLMLGRTSVLAYCHCAEAQRVGRG